MCYPIIFILFTYIICIPQKCQGQEYLLRLTVKGKDSLETTVIDSISYQQMLKNYESLTHETDSLRQKLEYLGYVDIEDRGIEKESDTSFLANFYLNKKYKFLKVHYNDAIFPKKIIEKISVSSTKHHFTLPFSKTEISLKYLTNYLVSQGKTFSAIQLLDLEKKKDTVLARLIHKESKPRTIDSIVIKGYEKFPKSYLRYYSRIKKGQKFSRETLLEKANTLNTLRFVKNIKAPQVLFTKEATAVYLYLKKNTANTFDGFIGFATDEETQNLIFDGYLNLGLVNNLNYGEIINLIYKSDGNEQQRFQANTTLPYLFKTPLAIEAGLDIFKKDSTFLNTEQLVNLHYTLGTRSDVYVGYKKSTSSNLLETPQVALDISDYDATYITMGLDYKIYQSNSLFPIKTHINIATEIGNRTSKTIKNSQYKGLGFVKHVLNLNRRNSIFFGNTAAILVSDDYIFNELFRFGGITSIRGFEENSLNASLFNVTNTEYRYLLSSDLYVHSIIDYAYYEDKSNEISNNLTSIGFGLGLNTKSGLFKINFANGKSKDQSFKFSNTKVHFSVVAFF